jgi:hypothetical protein
MAATSAPPYVGVTPANLWQHEEPAARSVLSTLPPTVSSSHLPRFDETSFPFDENAFDFLDDHDALTTSFGSHISSSVAGTHVLSLARSRPA